MAYTVAFVINIIFTIFWDKVLSLPYPHQYYQVSSTALYGLVRHVLYLLMLLMSIEAVGLCIIIGLELKLLLYRGSDFAALIN